MNPKISEVQINVSDMDKAIDFYCEKIGFKIKTRELYPQLVSLKNDSVTFLLNKVAEPAKIIYPSESCILINIQVEDIEESIKDLKSRNVEFLHDKPQTCPEGLFAAMRDPSGNILGLLEFSKKQI